MLFKTYKSLFIIVNIICSLIRARTNKFYKKCMDTTSVLLKLICNNYTINNAAKEHCSKVTLWNDFVVDNKLTL